MKLLTKLFFLIALIVGAIECHAQLNSSVKAIQSLNADSATVRYLAKNTVTNYGDSTTAGWMYYNRTSKKWRVYTNGVWKDLISTSSSGIGGSTGPVDNRILRADGTSGNKLQNSLLGIDDSGNIIDANANVALAIGGTSSATGYLAIGQSNALNTEVDLAVVSSDPNVALHLASKGNREIEFQTNGGQWDLTGAIFRNNNTAAVFQSSTNLARIEGNTSVTVSTSNQGTATSGSVTIASGNVSGGTGNSGNISISTGTSAGGSRGTLSTDALTTTISSSSATTVRSTGNQLILTGQTGITETATTGNLALAATTGTLNLSSGGTMNVNPTGTYTINGADVVLNGNGGNHKLELSNTNGVTVSSTGLISMHGGLSSGNMEFVNDDFAGIIYIATNDGSSITFPGSGGDVQLSGSFKINGIPILKGNRSSSVQDFANTVSLGETTITGIAVTGASTTGLCTVSAPSSVGVFTCRVTGSGTISITFHNTTAAPVDPASGTYQYCVTEP